ncbi:trypsin-like peptidase domain-containing protein [Clostridium carnis]
MDKESKELKEDSYPIHFKRKKTKSSIRFGSKVIGIFILAGMAGVLFSNIMMRVKYDKIIKQIDENRINNEMVILNYSNLIKKVSPSLVSISDEESKLLKDTYFDSNITGIILDQSGTILTNYSKVKNNNNIYVKLASAGVRPIKANLLWGNEEIDIAVIKIDYSGELAPIKFADNRNGIEGQEIAVLSNSIGDDYIGRIIPGMVTSTNKSINNERKKRSYRLLELNSIITEHNTGGAVCNSKGELIGIASSEISKRINQPGLYYAVDLSSLKSIISSSNILKEALGLLGGGIVSDENSEVSGFYVENIEQGGSAYNAGIKPTDIIFELDNKKFASIKDMSEFIREKKNGEVIKAKVMRDGKEKEIDIIVSKPEE